MTRFRDPWYARFQPKLTIAIPGFSTRLRDPETKEPYPKPRPKHHHVGIWRIGLIDWLLYRAYHWYDMRIPVKIPGYRKFIEHYKKVTSAEMRAFPMEGEPGPRLRDRLVGWEYEQDIRCYHLSTNHLGELLLMVDLTEEQYNEISTRKPAGGGWDDAPGDDE